MNEDWRAWAFSGIYAIRHVESGKMYVGQAKNIARRISEHKGQRKSAPHLRNAIACYGWDAFEVIILERVSNLTQLNEREQYWLDTLNVCQCGFNISPTARTCRGVKHSAEHNAKIAMAQAGKHHTDETKAKLSAIQKGIPDGPKTIEHLAKIGAGNRGKRITDEHKAKISAFRSGKVVSPETRAKLSVAATGKHPSEETKAKLRAARIKVVTPHATEDK